MITVTGRAGEPWATFHLAKGVATALTGKAAYPRTRGLNPVRYAEMVREHLRDHQRIQNAELRELPGLVDSASASLEASRYLTNQVLLGKPFYTLK